MFSLPSGALRFVLDTANAAKSGSHEVAAMTATSVFTRFLVAGAGAFGLKVVYELAKSPHAEVTVLTRKSSPSLALGSRIKVVQVDYDDDKALQRALKGIEVVVCAHAGAGLARQLQLAAAARKAGVKLFVPS